jgi:integrase/recombinase XerD
MVTTPTMSGYRTRLIDLLGPDAALAEAIAASLYSRLTEREKEGILSSTNLFAERSLQDCLSLAEGELYTSHQMTDIFDAYRKHLFICDLEPKTKARYWEIVNSYRKWLVNKRPDATTAQEFLAYLREKGYRPRSVLLYYHALRLFLGFRGIQLKLKLRKPRELPSYHSQQEIETLIAQAEIGLRGQKQWHKERNKAMILTFCYTGLRKQELLNLKVCNIDFDRRLLSVKQGKGRKDRVIPLAERLIAPLHSQCDGKSAQDVVFSNLNPRSVYRVITKLSEACGLQGIHPHTLRHYFATRLVESGVNLRVVQELLGHADLSTTAIYLDVSPMHLKSAIEALDDNAPISSSAYRQTENHLTE